MEFVPNKTITLSAEQERQWSNIIGGLMLNFGSLELTSLRWVQHLSNDEVLNDLAIDLSFTKRLKLISRLVHRTKWSPENKNLSEKLWREASKLSEIRNTVAHNPLVFGNGPDGDPAPGIFNLKDAKGVGPFSVKLLDFAMIHTTALRFAELSRDLSNLLAQIDGSDPESTMNRRG
jgi:hypothetical protein